MARIRLTLPTYFSFTTQLSVRITDINYGGHLGNDSVLSLIHEARMQFLLHHGYSELAFAGVGMIMSDVAIEFRNEAFFGELLQVDVTATEFSKVGFDLYYRLRKPGDAIVAQAKTGMICFDYENRKVVPVPEEARTKLAGETIS